MPSSIRKKKLSVVAFDYSGDQRVDFQRQRYFEKVLDSWPDATASCFSTIQNPGRRTGKSGPRASFVNMLEYLAR